MITPDQLLDVKIQLFRAIEDIADPQHDKDRLLWRIKFCALTINEEHKAAERYFRYIRGWYVSFEDEGGVIRYVLPGDKVEILDRVEVNGSDYGTGPFNVQSVNPKNGIVTIYFEIPDQKTIYGDTMDRPVEIEITANNIARVVEQ